MKTTDQLKRILPLTLAPCLAFTAGAQVATVDISNPTNPVVTYDANPYVYAPDLPPDPTAIHLDGLTIPPGSAITSRNTLALESAVLLDAGAAEGTLGVEVL